METIQVQTREKKIRTCEICRGTAPLSRAELRRHVREIHQGAYWNGVRTKLGRTIARNHDLRKPGKNYRTPAPTA